MERWKEGLDATFTRHSNRRVWDEIRSNNLIYEYFAATRNRTSGLRVFRYCVISRLRKYPRAPSLFE